MYKYRHDPIESHTINESSSQSLPLASNSVLKSPQRQGTPVRNIQLFTQAHSLKDTRPRGQQRSMQQPCQQPQLALQEQVLQPDNC